MYAKYLLSPGYRTSAGFIMTNTDSEADRIARTSGGTRTVAYALLGFRPPVEPGNFDALIVDAVADDLLLKLYNMFGCYIKWDGQSPKEFRMPKFIIDPYDYI